MIDANDYPLGYSEQEARRLAMEHSKLPLARSSQFLLSRIGRHVGIALWSGMVVPPAASLILLETTVLFSNWPGWGDPASAVPSFLVLFFIFAVPVGYVFGGIPALLAGAIYSAALTAMPVLNARRLLRVALGAVCGGLTGGIWFHTIAGPGSSSYAIVEALMMALFAGLRGRANDLAGFPAPRSPSWAFHPRRRLRTTIPFGPGYTAN